MKFTRRSKSKVEAGIDDYIDKLIDKAKTPEDIARIIELVTAKNEMLAAKPVYLKADTIALIVANLAGILLILGYERLNVITSKAMGMIWRGRV